MYEYEFKLKIYQDLLKMYDISNSSCGLMLGCSQIYIKYEKEVSRFKFIFRYKFLNLLKKTKNINVDKAGYLEDVIEIFSDKDRFKSFIENNKQTIEAYGPKEKDSDEWGLWE